MSGRAQGMDLEGPEAQRLTGLDGPPARRSSRVLALLRLPRQLALERAREDLELGPSLLQLGHLAHVVEVMVCQQHVRGRHLQAPGGIDQRPHGAARIDEERRSARSLADQVGIGKEAGMARAFDDHGAMVARSPQAGWRARRLCRPSI